MEKPRRVVVTGLGAVSPAGNDPLRLWEALLEGRPAFRPVQSLDTSDFRTHVGAEVAGFAPRDCRAYAVEAARQALEGASINPARTGVAVGTTLGEWLAVERALDAGEDPSPFFPGAIPAELSRRFSLGGPSLSATSACTAGNVALAWARDRIAAGRADAMLAGGADVFNRIIFSVFSRLLALAPEACAPFSLGRRGLIASEGSAMLLLEELETARRRGAKIYAELLGWGVSSDARHVTTPDAGGVRRAIEDCLRSSGLAPGEVDYISAHGTGTPANDKTESAAVAAVFGPKVPPLSSIKSVLGHAMGAATAFEAVACALALETGWVPPTAGHTPGDPDCPLDCVAEGKRLVSPKVVLSNGFAFGGSNAVVALSKPGRPLPQRAAARVVVTGTSLVEEEEPVPLAERLLPGRDLGVLDRAAAYALCGAKLALDDAKAEGSERAGIILDSSGELESQKLFYEDLKANGAVAGDPAQFPNILANGASSRAAIVLGLKRANLSLGGLFPGGEAAAVCGWDFIREHPEALLLCGGVHENGASFIVLESLEAAQARGARVLAELAEVAEGFDGRPGKAACGCLAAAVRAGKPVELKAQSRWGGWVRISIKPVI